MHLPFKGAPEAMTEVIAGRSDYYFSPLVNALPLMKDGQLQALAVSNASRASALPDLPTVAQAGYPQSEYNFWAGVFLPVKTPAPIKEKLYAEVKKALEAPAVREQAEEPRRRSVPGHLGAVRRHREERDREQFADREGREHPGGVIDSCPGSERQRRDPGPLRNELGPGSRSLARDTNR